MYMTICVSRAHLTIYVKPSGWELEKYVSSGDLREGTKIDNANRKRFQEWTDEQISKITGFMLCCLTTKKLKASDLLDRSVQQLGLAKIVF